MRKGQVQLQRQPKHHKSNAEKVKRSSGATGSGICEKDREVCLE